LAYEEYYQDIKMRFEVSKNKIQRDYTQKMSQVKDGPLDLLVVEQDEKVKVMEENFEKTVQLLLASYEKYLQDNLPQPSFLPVTVSIRVESKSIRFDNITVKPTDCIRDLKEILVAKFEELKNPITAPFSPNNIFVLLRPFDKGLHKGKEDAMDIDAAYGNLNPDVVVLMDETKPIMQFKVQPGSEFVLKGEIHLLSDKPKQCFIAMFKKGQSLTMNYYTCKDCKLNWICENCAENCHKGHKITQYIMNHVPTWACCYCVKYKTCKIQTQ